MATSNAPLQIGRVALTVNDIVKVGDFYQNSLGLDPINSDGETLHLGAGGQVLLELRADPAARRATPREAGLFHSAFLLPDRAALGAWLRHFADQGGKLDGAADHLVSEALYLHDPEGNGIEVYVDRPRMEWTLTDKGVRMASDPLDLNDLAASATGPWRGAPEGSVVGHVHLQVGDLDTALPFYADTLGMALTCRYPGANFFGSGGYHHHIATNTWNSKGAAPRTYPSTGLTEVELLGDAASVAALRARTDGTALNDPWATAFTIRDIGT